MEHPLPPATPFGHKAASLVSSLGLPNKKKNHTCPNGRRRRNQQNARDIAYKGQGAHAPKHTVKPPKRPHSATTLVCNFVATQVPAWIAYMDQRFCKLAHMQMYVIMHAHVPIYAYMKILPFVKTRCQVWKALPHQPCATPSQLELPNSGSSCCLNRCTCIAQTWHGTQRTQPWALVKIEFGLHTCFPHQDSQTNGHLREQNKHYFKNIKNKNLFQKCLQKSLPKQ